MKLSQKEVSFQVISSLRSEGKSDQEILLLGPPLLLERFKRGEWEKSKGSSEDLEVLKYSKNLLKNWMMKDERLNPGGYTPKNPRGPRNPSTPKSDSPDLRKVLEYLRGNDPENHVLIQDIEERIMWEEIKKVG